MSTLAHMALPPFVYIWDQNKFQNLGKSGPVGRPETRSLFVLALEVSFQRFGLHDHHLFFLLLVSQLVVLVRASDAPKGRGAANPAATALSMDDDGDVQMMAGGGAAAGGMGWVGAGPGAGSAPFQLNEHTTVILMVSNHCCCSFVTCV